MYKTTVVTTKMTINDQPVDEDCNKTLHCNNLVLEAQYQSYWGSYWLKISFDVVIKPITNSTTISYQWEFEEDSSTTLSIRSSNVCGNQRLENVYTCKVELRHEKETFARNVIITSSATSVALAVLGLLVLTFRRNYLIERTVAGKLKSDLETQSHSCDEDMVTMTQGK